MKKTKKILIIEDEPDAAETMKMLIEREGYEVEYVLDPRKGMKKIKEFDLLLLDIRMPKMSGRQILNEIEKNGIKIPIIIVSAIGLPEEMGRKITKNHPKVSFVEKTHMHDRLIEKIREKIGE